MLALSCLQGPRLLLVSTLKSDKMTIRVPAITATVQVEEKRKARELGGEEERTFASLL